MLPEAVAVYTEEARDSEQVPWEAVISEEEEDPRPETVFIWADSSPIIHPETDSRDIPIPAEEPA